MKKTGKHTLTIKDLALLGILLVAEKEESHGSHTALINDCVESRPNREVTGRTVPEEVRINCANYIRQAVSSGYIERDRRRHAIMLLGKGSGILEKMRNIWEKNKTVSRWKSVI